MRLVHVFCVSVAPSLGGAVLGVVMDLTPMQVVACIVCSAVLAGYALLALTEDR